MVRRSLRWLKELPAICLDLLQELWQWSLDCLETAWEWLCELPGRLKALVHRLVEATRQLIEWTIGAIVASLGWALSFPGVLVRKLLAVDLRSVPKNRITVRERGRNLALFGRQFSALIQGGIALVPALDILAEQSEEPTLGYLSGELATRLGEGYSLSKAVSEYPKVFPPVFVHLTKAGEETGRLVVVVERLADLLERDSNLVRKVRGALSYPMFVLVLTFFLTLGLFSTVLPGFAEFYRDFDVELPLVTAFLMRVTEMVSTAWFWLALGLVIAGSWFLFRRLWEAEPSRRQLFALFVQVPLVGSIVESSCLARYCWVMELTQNAGMDLMRALRLAGLSSGSPILEHDSSRLVKGITEGESLSLLMKEREWYPNLLDQLVLLGEETSHLGDCFGRAALWLEEDVESRLESFQAALEPFLMGLISLVVGTIITAVFLPLYGLLESLGV